MHLNVQWFSSNGDFLVEIQQNRDCKIQLLKYLKFQYLTIIPGIFRKSAWIPFKLYQKPIFLAEIIELLD